MNKKGLSTVIITLIIILVSLVAVGIIWIVVRNVIQSGSEGISMGQFTLSAKIMDVNLENASSANNVNLTVKRNPGEGEFTSLKFVFYDGKDSEVVTQTVSLDELEERRFNFHLIIVNVSRLVSISVVPILSKNGKETIGDVLDKYIIRGNEQFQFICSPFAGCSSWGYVCGNWTNGTCSGALTNCGDCGGLVCNSNGQCVASCTPTTCAAQGYQCGTPSNGTCSGNLNCGPITCDSFGAGYTCNASYRCVPSASSSYLKLSGNGRYLTYQNNTPFFLVGDTAWSMIGQLSDQDANAYLANRSNYGFNTILVSLIEHKFSTNAPSNIYGQAPFTGRPFATPNEAYFAHADYIINSAIQKGMVVLLDPIYVGYACNDEGWCAELNAATLPELRQWGQFIGNRYKNYSNIIWVIGGDADPVALSLTAKLQEIVNGIRDNDTNHLFTADNEPESMAVDAWPGAPWLNVNSVYTYSNVYGPTQTAYLVSPTMPFFFFESNYENEHSITNQGLRAQEYWSVLSGAFGHLFGNCPMWNFNAPAGASYCAVVNWRTQLTSAGTNSMRYFQSLFSSIKWYNLVPDFSHVAATAGYGTWGNSDYATTAYALDGSLIATYLPTVRTITINMTKMGGSTTARWFDPSNGQYTTIAGSPFPNTGTRTFTPSGNNAAGDTDWVLLLESSGVPVVYFQVSVTKSGSGSGTVTGTGINCGIDCSESIVNGTSITLIAAPDANSTFVNWSGACSGSTSTSCTFTVANNIAVNARFNFSSVAVPSGTIGYWKFDENTGISAIDSSGNGNTGTLVNGPLWVAGKHNSALSFDGINDYVSVPHNSILNPAPAITLSAWVNGRNFKTCDGIIAKESNYVIQIGCVQPDELEFSFYNGAWYEFETPSVNLQKNVWYYVAATFNETSDSVEIYVNGNRVYQANTTANMNRGNVNPVTIGSSTGAIEFFNGTIDDAMIFSRVLTQAEINAIYIAG